MFLLELEVVQGERLTRSEFTVPESGKVLIGRLECDLLLEHRTVSRKHLGFSVRSGRLIASDLDSTTGTRQNGQELRQAFVKKGDVFGVGPYLIRVRRFSPSKYQEPTPERSVSHTMATSTFLIPMVGPGGILPSNMGRFYLAFLKQPRAVWSLLPRELTAKDVFGGLPAHGLVAAMLMALACSHMGVSFNIWSAINYAIWWMVGLLAVGVVLSRGLLSLVGSRSSWGQAMSWVLSVSALWFPFALVGALWGTTHLLALAPMAIPVGMAALGFWRIFRPDNRRLVRTAAVSMLVLGLLLGGSVMVPRWLHQGERQLASAPVTQEEIPQETAPTAIEVLREGGL